MIVHNGSAGTIQSLVDSGYAGGKENGSGIISSTAAAAGRTLGVLLNNNGSGGAIYSSFDGQPVSTSDVLVKYTLVGDADLDGTVGLSDLTDLASNYGRTSGATWAEGDCDGDGKVDLSDLTDLASNYGDNLSGSISAAPSTARFSQDLAELEKDDPALGAAIGPIQSAVPEPSTMALVGTVAIALRRRICRGG